MTDAVDNGHAEAPQARDARRPSPMPVRREPMVTALLCDNPSPFTHTGTWTHLVGTSDLAIIDPGPDGAAGQAHLDRLVDAIAGRPVRAIVITHTHLDHSPLARPLAAATGAPIIGAAPLAPPRDADGRPDPAFDPDHRPARVLADGDQVTGDGWTLSAIATPGHASNHLCFALEETKALFTGDHVMGWSTSVVAPPDGDMAAYLASLERLVPRDDRIYYPAHGDPVGKPAQLLRGMIGHRRQRERQLLRALGRDPATPQALVPLLYPALDPGLRGAAAASLHAHLIALAASGQAVATADGWRAA